MAVQKIFRDLQAQNSDDFASVFYHAIAVSIKIALGI